MTNAFHSPVHSGIAVKCHPSHLASLLSNDMNELAGDDPTSLPPQFKTSPGGNAEKEGEALMHGDERILLVDDNPMVLNATQSILESYGYTVLLAQSPKEAMQVARDHAGAIHMLITDIVMPGMNGLELAEGLLANDANMKCLYMSGYSNDIITDLGELGPDVHFIQKPFSVSALTIMVREILDQ